MSQKLWGKRFNKRRENPLVESFNASIGFDKRLYQEDITGSIAYARALQRAGILSPKESVSIQRVLKSIQAAIKAKRFKFDGMEDIHTAIEVALTKRLGDTAKKIHTGRSRNEQVVLDERMYLKKEIREIVKNLVHLEKVIINQAEKQLGCVMPGYTHLQQAQPILFSHYIMAWFFMLERDRQRLSDCFKRVNICPLGSGALAGNCYRINRTKLAQELDFASVSDNALDATGDRDFIAEFLAVASILMMHLSRFCEDLVIWSTSEFGFVQIDDTLATSSSLMPQKKNPDTVELIRAKSGRVLGNLISLLTLMKGLPLGYNKDMQEDKLPLFDTVDTIKSCLKIFSLVVTTLKINRKKMKGSMNSYMLSTDLVDYLVKKGVAFRPAHEIVSKLVRYATDESKSLPDISLAEFKRFSPKFTKDVYRALDFQASVNSRNLPGATSNKMVRAQIKTAWRYLRGGV